jgi:carbamoyltransferase
MSVCVEAKENINSVIPAVLHPSDFTARIHLVKKEINNDYYDLIKNFKQISGIGLILNTSLNLHGKPIARNANDCLEILNKSDIDGMQIENFLIIKKNNNKNYLL